MWFILLGCQSEIARYFPQSAIGNNTVEKEIEEALELERIEELERVRCENLEFEEVGHEVIKEGSVRSRPDLICIAAAQARRSASRGFTPELEPVSEKQEDEWKSKEILDSLVSNTLKRRKSESDLTSLDFREEIRRRYNTRRRPDSVGCVSFSTLTKEEWANRKNSIKRGQEWLHNRMREECEKSEDKAPMQDKQPIYNPRRPRFLLTEDECDKLIDSLPKNKNDSSSNFMNLINVLRKQDKGILTQQKNRILAAIAKNEFIDNKTLYIGLLNLLTEWSSMIE